MAGPRKTQQTALGRLLQERRLAKGLSRTRIGELVGVSPFSLESWEQGRVAKPPIHDVLRLARFLDISAQELENAVLAETGPPPAAPPQPEPAVAPLLEQAVDVLGLGVDEVAEILSTTPTRIRALRRGDAELNVMEVMVLTAVIAAFAHAPGATPRVRGREAAETLKRLRGSSS